MFQPNLLYKILMQNACSETEESDTEEMTESRIRYECGTIFYNKCYEKSKVIILIRYLCTISIWNLATALLELSQLGSLPPISNETESAPDESADLVTQEVSLLQQET